MPKAKNDFDDEELCEYCPLQAELDELPPPSTPSNPMGCEGIYCDEAYDNYLDVVANG